MTTGPDEGAGRAGDHPDLETLAELQEGLLTGQEERRVRRHLATCGRCGDAVAGLDATRGLLAELPPAPLPDDVAARLEATLAELPPVEPTEAEPAGTEPAGAEAAATVVPGGTLVAPRPGRTPWWRGSAFASSAAAAAVVLLIAAVIAGALRTTHHGSTGNTTAGSAAGSSPGASTTATFTTMASGRNYTESTLVPALPSLLGTAAAAGAGAATPAPSGTNQPSGTSQDSAKTTNGPVAPMAEPPGQLAPVPALAGLTQPRRLLDCVSGLTGQPAGAVTPLAVDLASYQGKPAAIVVLPSPNRPAEVDIWVVGPGCSSKTEQIIYFRRAAKP